MSTQSVRFDFQCENRKLEGKHDLPAELIRPGKPGDHPPGYMDLFVKTLEPIIDHWERPCYEASGPNCSVCGEPKVKALMTPMSWLHNPGDPFINVWVAPICQKEKCEFVERGRIQEAMQVLGEAAQVEGENGEVDLEGYLAGKKRPDGLDTKKVLRCKICGKVEGAKQCSGCKVVAYCGKEHQKADWRVHKKLCGELASQEGQGVNVM